MRYKIPLAIIFLTLSTHVLAVEGKKITKADASDYIDCAAFYASVITSLTTQGTLDEAREISLKERGNFYLETAKIYDGVTELSLEMKSKFLTANKEYVASAYTMLKDPDKDVYSNYVDVRISECKTMLDINAKLLTEKQRKNIK